MLEILYDSKKGLPWKKGVNDLNRRRIRSSVLRTCLFLTVMLAIAAIWLPSAQPVSAESGADIDITSKAVSKSVVKLNWSENHAALKQSDFWKIRCSVVNETTGRAKEYSVVKKLKKGTKSCRVKGLDANTHYRFEVSGYIKKKGKSRLAFIGKEDNYTGIATPKWDDRAPCDDAGNEEVIPIVLLSNQKGLPVRGYEIQRRNASEDKDFKKLATVRDSDQNDAGEIVYKDSSVEKGTAYQYRVRAYTGKKKNRTYSPFSGKRTRYAIDREGTFTIKKKSLKEDEMVLCITSSEGNADLMLDAHDIFFGDQSDEHENPIYIEAYSRDGKDWTKLVMLRPQAEAANVRQTEGKNYVTLKGNKKIYLRFVPVEDGTDLSKLGKNFSSSDISYNGCSSEFSFSIRSLFGGKGKGTATIK